MPSATMAESSSSSESDMSVLVVALRESGCRLRVCRECRRAGV